MNSRLFWQPTRLAAVRPIVGIEMSISRRAEIPLPLIRVLKPEPLNDLDDRADTNYPRSAQKSVSRHWIASIRSTVLWSRHFIRDIGARRCGDEPKRSGMPSPFRKIEARSTRVIARRVGGGYTHQHLPAMYRSGTCEILAPHSRSGLLAVPELLHQIVTPAREAFQG
jgi:hypothetical protein